jgi:ubiquinone/menaquinone biosynthesis C-methylase UbiE
MTALSHNRQVTVANFPQQPTSGKKANQLEEIYRDGKYEQQNPTWHEEDSPWKAKQIANLLADNKVHFQRLCEVGCGTGEILVQLSKRFPDADFTGYEISPQAFEMAARKRCPKLNFYLKDLLQEPVAYFDVLLVIDVIEHVESYIDFIRSIKRFAGLKVFHIPLDLSVQSLIRVSPILGQRRSVGHIHYFLKDTALATLQDCGYRIIDSRYTASRLELPNQALSSRIMATPRRLLHKMNPDLAVRVLGGYSLLVLCE